MLIVSAYIDMELPYVHSLKGRRKILHSIKDRLKNRNISLLDISGEYPKEATLALCFLALNQQKAQEKLHTIQELIASTFPDLEFDFHYEIL